ncbi:MAG: ATP-binding protein [Gaiellaceae bacterium]
MVDNDSAGRATGNSAAYAPSGRAALDQIVGRGSELDAIQRFLEDVSQRPGLLIIEGEAGVGKTTLWAAGVETARQLGYQVVAARPAEMAPLAI